MQLFLHIIFSDETIAFESDLRIWLKQNLPSVSYYDIDQNSEELVVRTAIEAINKADRTFAYLEGSTAKPQAVFKIIKQLQKEVAGNSIQVINNSNNPLIKKLGNAFGLNWQDDVPQKDLKQSIINFFTTQA